MSKLNQKGVVHLFVPLILLLGLIVGVYLVTSGNPLKLFSKASLSKPVGPETSFTLVGPAGCNAGPLCAIYERQTLAQKFEVKLYARSDIEKANLFTAKMTFPKDLVEVTGINKDGSFVGNWVEEFYDNATGEISLVGGVPAPGYQTTVGGEGALMATISFNAKALGKGAVSLTDSSQILSNLNNINILTIKRPYQISIEVKPVSTPTSAPVVSPSATPMPDSDSCKDLYATVTASFGSTCTITASGKQPYNPVADINKDKQINITDSSTVSGNSSNPLWCAEKLADKSNPCVTVCKPRPECLDAKPACAIAEPVGGWCAPSSSPTPSPVQKGDGNQDGKINLIDMSVIHTDWMKDQTKVSNFRGGIDMNNDGLINTFDFSAHRNILLQLGVIKSR